MAAPFHAVGDKLKNVGILEVGLGISELGQTKANAEVRSRQLQFNFLGMLRYQLELSSF